MALGSPSGSGGNSRTVAGVGSLGPGTYNIPTQNQQETNKALVKTYRAEYGIAMTDAEYAARKQQEAADQRANVAVQHPQPVQQRAGPSSAALQGIQAVSGYSNDPLTTYYTGQPTSDLEADKQRMALEQQNNAVNLQGRVAANDAAFDKRYAAAQSLMSQPLPGDTGGGAGSPVDPALEAAARAAAFARAKEQAGHTAHASLRALQDVFAGRGMMGSSAETNAIGGVVGNAAGQVDEFTRDQLMTDLNRSADVADRNYQGNLAKRAQDINMRQSLMAILNQTGGLY